MSQAGANYAVHFLNALLKQDSKVAELLERTFELPGNHPEPEPEP